MNRAEKTALISEHRSNAPWAPATFPTITQRGYDASFNLASVNSGDFP